MRHGDRNGLIDSVPESHKKFLKEAHWVIEHPDYLFVHAGLNHTQPVSEQMRVFYFLFYFIYYFFIILYIL